MLNRFIWQDDDPAPDHPRMYKVTEYGQTGIEGPLHSVKFAHRKQIAPGEWRNLQGESRLH